jgi:hypothetical protein
MAGYDAPKRAPVSSAMRAGAGLESLTKVN